MASSAEPQKTFAEKLQHEFSDLLKLALTASDEVYYPSWKTTALKGYDGSTEGDYAGLRVYPMGHYKVLVVAVVGTITVEQWISNFTFSPAEDGFHQEFKRCAEEFWKELGEEVRKRAELCNIVLIVGHSRGAAIALNLFGQAVVHQGATSAFKEKLRLITFASPRICKENSDFESKIKQAAKKVRPEGLESMVAIYHNKLDPVTKVPLNYVLPVPAKCVVSIGPVIDSPNLVEHHLMPEYRINVKQHLQPTNWVVCTGAVKLSASVAQAFLTVAPLIGFSHPALAPAGVMLNLLSTEKQDSECLKQLEMQIKHGHEKLEQAINQLVERDVKKDLSLLRAQVRECHLELQSGNIDRQRLRDIEDKRNKVKFHLQDESESAHMAHLAAILLGTFTLEVRCWLHLNDAQKFETLPGTIRIFLTDLCPALDIILRSGHIEETLEIAIMDFFNLLLGLPRILDKSMDDFGVNGENDIFQNLFDKYGSSIRERFWDAVVCRESLQLCWDHQEKVDKVEEMIAAASTSKLPSFEEQKKVLQELEKALFPPESEESQESEEGEERYLDQLCLRACISGATNAGKSTLFNALSGKLVSPISHSGNTVLPMTLIFLGNRDDFHITIKAPFLKHIPRREGLGIKEEKPGMFKIHVQEEEMLQQVLVDVQTEIRDKMNQLNKEQPDSEVFDHLKATDEIIIEMPGDFRPLTLTDVPGTSEGGPMGQWMRDAAAYQKNKAHLELRMVDAGSDGVEMYIKKTEETTEEAEKAQKPLLLVNKVKDDEHIEEIKKKFQNSKKDHKNVMYTSGMNLLAHQLLQSEKELLGPLSESEIENEQSAGKKKLLYRAAFGDFQNHKAFVKAWDHIRTLLQNNLVEKCSACDNFALRSFLETAASQHWAKCSERLLEEAAIHYDEMAITYSMKLDVLKGKFDKQIEKLEEFLRLDDQQQMERLKNTEKYKEIKKQLDDGIKILQQGTEGWQLELLRHGWHQRCVDDLSANAFLTTLPQTDWSSHCQNSVCAMMVNKLRNEEEIEETTLAALNVLDRIVALATRIRANESVAALSHAIDFFAAVATAGPVAVAATCGVAFLAGCASMGWSMVGLTFGLVRGATLAGVTLGVTYVCHKGTWGAGDLSSEAMEKKILEASLKVFIENAPKIVAKCKELKEESHDEIAALELKEARCEMKAAALCKFAKATFGPTACPNSLGFAA